MMITVRRVIILGGGGVSEKKSEDLDGPLENV
jgi:hypothetical protein